MIEQWNISIIYDTYYKQYQPNQCIYIDRARNDAIFIITTLLGLLGGLITALKFTVPHVIKLLRRRRKRLSEQPIPRTRKLADEIVG